MNDSLCKRKTLAANDYMLVEQCTCGSVHVTIGAVTLRLSSNAIPAIAATLGEASRALVFNHAFAPSARTNTALS